MAVECGHAVNAAVEATAGKVMEKGGKGWVGYRLATRLTPEVVGISSCVLVAASAVIYLYLWWMNIELAPVTFRKQGDAVEYALHLLTYLAIGAVLEEGVFRGIIQSSLKGKVGAPAAIIVSSALFTLWHFGNSDYLMLAPLYFVLGIGLGIVFDSTSRLVPTILAHFAYNCAASMLPIVTTVPLHHESALIPIAACVAIALVGGWLAWLLSLRLSSRTLNA